MTKIHVRYGLTPADERHLVFGARLAAALGEQMFIWIHEDRKAQGLFEAGAVHSVRSMEDRAIREHVRQTLDGKVEANPRFVAGDPWSDLVDPDGILIGPRTTSTSSRTAFLATMDETDLRGRGDGPVCVPFGKGDSGSRAAEAVLPMAAKLGLGLIFYHTTYPNSKLPLNLPPERHMLSEVSENARVLREAADRRGVRHETVIQMADDIVGGLIQFAQSRDCLLIAMARSGRIGRGSQTIQTMQRSVIPVLVAKGRI